MKVRCAAVRHRLPGLDTADDLSPRLAAHFETCLRCQAEAARYRSLRRRMRALDGEAHPAPGTLLDAVAAAVAAPEGEEESSSPVRRVAIAASAAGAFLVAGAGTIIVIGLRRSHTAA